MAVIIDNNKDVNLNGGTKVNVELVDGKLQLSLIGTVALPSADITPNMTSNTTPAPYAVATSSEYGSGWTGYLAFDGIIDNTHRWASSTLPAWIRFDFGAAKTIRRYAITGMVDSSVVNQNPKIWTFEGSNNATNWTVLDTQTDIINWSLGETKIFDITNDNSYRYYRLNITDANGQTFTSIVELEMMELEQKNKYASSGVFESDIIDLSQYVRQIGSVTNVSTIPTETTANIYTSTSNDYVNFSDWSLVDVNGNITSPQRRYIKVKIELIGDNKIYNTIVNGFTEAEKTQFEENSYIDFDGSLKLKTTYEEQLEKDLSWTYDGALFRKSIDVSNFKTIEKFKVI